MKLLVFPAGTLTQVPSLVRAAALSGGLVMFVMGRQSLALGVAGGSILLALLEVARSGGFLALLW